MGDGFLAAIKLPANWLLFRQLKNCLNPPFGTVIAATDYSGQLAVFELPPRP
jgi:hypothetical protein